MGEANNTSGVFALTMRNTSQCIMVNTSVPKSPAVVLGSCDSFIAPLPSSLWLYNSRGQFQSAMQLGTSRLCLALSSDPSAGGGSGSVVLDNFLTSSALNRWLFVDDLEELSGQVDV